MYQSHRAVLHWGGWSWLGLGRCLDTPFDVTSEITHLALGDLTQHSVVMLDQAREIYGVAVSARKLLIGEPAPAPAQQSLEPMPMISDYIVRHGEYSWQFRTGAVRAYGGGAVQVMRGSCRRRGVLETAA